MAHIGAATDKEVLFQEVWGYEFQGSTNLVEVGVRRLREKIEVDPSNLSTSAHFVVLATDSVVSNQVKVS